MGNETSSSSPQPSPSDKTALFLKYRSTYRRERHQNPSILWVHRFLLQIGGALNIDALQSFTDALIARQRAAEDRMSDMVACNSCERKFSLLSRVKRRCCGVCGRQQCSKCIQQKFPLLPILASRFGLRVVDDNDQDDDDGAGGGVMWIIGAHNTRDDESARTSASEFYESLSHALGRSRCNSAADILACDECTTLTRAFMFHSLADRYRHPTETAHNELVRLLPEVERHLRAFESQIQLLTDDALSVPTDMKDAVVASCNVLEEEIRPLFNRLFRLLDSLKASKASASTKWYRNRWEQRYDADVAKHMLKWLMDFMNDTRARYKQCRSALFAAE